FNPTSPAHSAQSKQSITGLCSEPMAHADQEAGAARAIRSDWDKEGLSALHRAARQGDAAEAQRLIEAGADVELQDQTRSRQRPLHYAAKEGHVAVLERLLAAKATLCAKDKRGYRPLHLAAEEGHVEVLERLLAAKATVEAENKYGRTPWQL
ncbi:Serine/threonine-protein phosphatase 6 regulatory ankyrin repeat subunit C (PP6-ARS-C) (Serine/threonine-protein phosphatase 6 regulatory subunit ARS-C), partial [Durusdinium trenchii]